ncbi:MAG: Asp-tRNA(Asn)/Glu-tRNA(Gln) amidotransferase subunit GatA [Nitrososphaerota archaeon]|nr:Asp-tRNA(Asn)/Glu-tRNA(Gln) amidotransferase subunit GatA [Nitrososphaerota archaeon]
MTGSGDGPWTAEGLARAYSAGTATPSSVVREQLKRIGTLNPALNAFITVLADSALRSAEESDRRYRSGNPRGPLDGVPVAVKDMIYIQGVKCTAGSKILADNVAPYDAPVVARLKSAGAVLMGTTNLHEFAAGTTSVNPHYGAVRNPWDLNKVAGGSSGGSAAAVASGMVPIALGTDTAGSVRIPAALCGVLGLKPTYGRVSRLGVIPLSASLDAVGVLARSAKDVGVMLRVVSGKDKEDMTAVEAEVPEYDAAPPLRSARVGVVKNRFQDYVDPRVEADFQAFVARLRGIGFAVVEVELDGLGEVYERWLPIRRAEATAFHLKWLKSAPELYGDDVRTLLELGRDVLAVDYVGAVNARPSYMERFSAAMAGVDALALPTTAVPAPGLGQSEVKVNGVSQPVYSALSRLTLPFNYVGFPVLSVPSGLIGGLPVGVQLVGKLFDEMTLLRLAAAYEEVHGLFGTPGGVTAAPPTG